MTDLLVQEKEQALAKFLGEEDTSNIHPDQWGAYEYANEEYLVFTDEEADEACKEYIRESLWAFKASFLVDYMNGHISPYMIQKVQIDSCEDCNQLIYALVKDKFEELVKDAISADGRGHFLASYDNEEHEEGEFYIYRRN